MHATNRNSTDHLSKSWAGKVSLLCQHQRNRFADPMQLKLNHAGRQQLYLLSSCYLQNCPDFLSGHPSDRQVQYRTVYLN